MSFLLSPDLMTARLETLILKIFYLSRSVFSDNAGKMFRQDHLLVEWVVQLFQNSFLLIFKA